MTKIGKYFVLEEFINPNDFSEHKEKSIELIDNRLIKIADFIRETVGKSVTINDWHTGGKFYESGLREQNTKTGAKKSAHKEGKAIDVKVSGFGGKEWYDFVKKYAKDLYQLGARRIEDKSLATTWLHIDTKEHGYPNVITVIDLDSVVEKIKIIGL